MTRATELAQTFTDHQFQQMDFKKDGTIELVFRSCLCGCAEILFGSYGEVRCIYAADGMETWQITPPSNNRAVATTVLTSAWRIFTAAPPSYPWMTFANCSTDGEGWGGQPATNAQFKLVLSLLSIKHTVRVYSNQKEALGSSYGARVKEGAIALQIDNSVFLVEPDGFVSPTSLTCLADL